MKRSIFSVALSALFSLFVFAVTAQSAHASSNSSVDVSSRTWIENGKEVSSVCINGKEVVSYSGDSGVASQKADNLALKLQTMFTNRKFDPNQILPAKDGTLAAVQQNGNKVLSFEATNSNTAKETSLRIVNAIRLAYGAPALPKCLVEITNAIAAFHSPAAPSFRLLGNKFSGQASWYGPHFHGKRCSDGSRFDQEQMTAAHRSLPFGTRLLVTNRATGKTCIVKINDRGPYIGNRVIDLSKGAARQLKMLSSGVAMVDCLVLGTN